jgi:hypothetical protein
MAYHGMGSGPDLTGLVIRGLERTGLAWDVRRPSPAAIARHRLPRAGDRASAAPGRNI